MGEIVYAPGVKQENIHVDCADRCTNQQDIDIVKICTKPRKISAPKYLDRQDGDMVCTMRGTFSVVVGRGGSGGVVADGGFILTSPPADALPVEEV